MHGPWVKRRVGSSLAASTDSNEARVKEDLLHCILCCCRAAERRMNCRSDDDLSDDKEGSDDEVDG